jgi:hypothetical protein
VAGELVTWIRAQLAAGRVPVLATDSTLDAIEVATRLAAEQLAVTGSRGVREAAQRLAKLEPVPAIKTPGKELAAIVRVDGDRAKLPAKAITALVSGRALDKHDHAAGFAWPFAAGRAQLLAWIEQTKAKDVFVTGACAATIVAALGKRARVLGPPHQMSLFEGDAR